MSGPAPLRVAIAGLGTVGAGTVALLASDPARLALRAGRPIELRAVSARDRDRDRGVALDDCRWVEDARDLAMADDVDVVVELIGGADGIALELTAAALRQGKAVVTANRRCWLAWRRAREAGREQRCRWPSRQRLQAAFRSSEPA